MTERFESGYLNMEEDVSASGKTKVVTIFSRNHGDLLGEIRWFGRWRTYAFFPEGNTAWNVGCLKEVDEYIEMLMEERRK